MIDVHCTALGNIMGVETFAGTILNKDIMSNLVKKKLSIVIVAFSTKTQFRVKM